MQLMCCCFTMMHILEVVLQYKVPSGWINCWTAVVIVLFIPVLDAFFSSEATRAGFWQPAVLSEPLVALLSALSSTAPCSTKHCTWSCTE